MGKGGSEKNGWMQWPRVVTRLYHLSYHISLIRRCTSRRAVPKASPSLALHLIASVRYLVPYNNTLRCSQESRDTLGCFSTWQFLSPLPRFRQQQQQQILASLLLRLSRPTIVSLSTQKTQNETQLCSCGASCDGCGRS